MMLFCRECQRVLESPQLSERDDAIRAQFETGTRVGIVSVDSWVLKETDATWPERKRLQLQKRKNLFFDHNVNVIFANCAFRSID